MTDYTLEDLARDAGVGVEDAGPDEPPEGADAEPADDGPSWVDRMMDRLEERGKLDEVIDAVIGEPPSPGAQGPQGRPPENTAVMDSAPAEPAANDAAAASAAPDANDMNTQELDAETVTTVLKQVYDNTHRLDGLDDDPTLSEMIRWVEENPRKVDMAIRMYA